MSKKKSWKKGAVGFDDFQWSEFLRITKAEGESLMAFHPNYWGRTPLEEIKNFHDLPLPVKQRFWSTIIQKLREQGAPTVEQKVVERRMNEWIRNVLRGKEKKARKEALALGSSDGEAVTREIGTQAAAAVPQPGLASAESSSGKLPYDAVRDFG